MTPAARPPLRDALASPAGKRLYARRLFSTIADRYDLITVLLSFGQDRHWKRRVAELSRATSGTRALDVACGTGDLAFALEARGAAVIGLDLTHRMLQLARARALRTAAHPHFIVGDMMALPFGNEEFDLVTAGYGLRNVPELAPAIDELQRVLKPGGMLLSLDFNRPANRVVRAVYLGYLTVVGSALGFLLHRDPDTYRYIPESIRRYPGAAAVNALIRTQGFSSSECLPVLGGLMAIHVAVK
jgi:demethylmenaquinone methyltransferase/2-methoxy-6-polyprenyl-1,4-benzoquinol methylase